MCWKLGASTDDAEEIQIERIQHRHSPEIELCPIVRAEEDTLIQTRFEPTHGEQSASRLDGTEHNNGSVDQGESDPQHDINPRQPPINHGRRTVRVRQEELAVAKNCT